jgi:alginate O-acetyltransferase complex protein AlgI
MIGWVLFRAATFADATSYFGALFGLIHPAYAQPVARYAGRAALWAIVFGAIFSVWSWNRFKSFCARQAARCPNPSRAILSNLGSAAEIVFVLALLVISAIWLADGTYNPFIYFRF